jgi:hypothetical protein
MALSIGKLGPYEILAPIGAGGIGTSSATEGASGKRFSTSLANFY